MIEERSAAWRAGQSWFMLLTLPLGFFSWLAFLYMGIRARRMKWIWISLYFLVMTVLVMEVGPRVTGAVGPDGRPTLTPMGGITMLFLWGFSIWYAWKDRREFLEILDVRQGGTPAPVPEFIPYEQLHPQATAPAPARPAKPRQPKPRPQPRALTPAETPPPAPAAPAPKDEPAPPAPRGARIVDF